MRVGAAGDRAFGRVAIWLVVAVVCVAADTSAALAMGGWSAPVKIDAGPALGSLRAISCPASSFCAAVDDGGSYLTFDGTSWDAPAKAGAEVEGYGGGISCVSKTFCAAIGGSAATTYNGTEWTGPTYFGAGGITSVSCASESFCVIVATSSEAAIYNGSKWSAATHISDRLLTSVSCTSESFCIASDEEGRVVTYNGASWSAPSRSSANRSRRCPAHRNPSVRQSAWKARQLSTAGKRGVHRRASRAARRSGLARCRAWALAV